MVLYNILDVYSPRIVKLAIGCLSENSIDDLSNSALLVRTPYTPFIIALTEKTFVFIFISFLLLCNIFSPFYLI